MTHHDRGRAIPLAVADMQVGVTDAGRQHPDADLPGARLDQIEVGDHDRRADGLQERTTDRHGAQTSAR